MAFRDQKLVMYKGSVLVEYKDKAHLYYVRDRVDYDLPITDAAAWSKKARRPKGTTTLLGDTLEKKGLALWPMGLALAELFGFYDFTDENGDRKTGFSKKNGGGTLWDTTSSVRQLDERIGEARLLELVLSASKAHTRAQKKGADIGSYVHEMIELFITATAEMKIDTTLTVAEYSKGQLWYDAFVAGTMTADEALERNAWLEIAEEEVALAQVALDNFCKWWEETQPVVVEAELIVYSKELDYSGAFDGLFKIQPKHHPVYHDWERPILVMEDHKTSKASKGGGAPEGVYYTYFAQNAAYARAYHEMTGIWVDDMMVVSTRKDGGFSVIYLSELGYTVEEAVKYWEQITGCYRMMDGLKRALVAHAAAV